MTLINTAQAGTPFNLTYSPNSLTAASTQITANYRGVNLYRPNRVPGQPLTQGRRVQAANTGYVQYVNFSALALPPTTVNGQYVAPFGNLSRNPGRSPAFYESDFDVNKRFSTPVDSLKVEFRGELYNLFNHTNLYLPSSGLSGTLGSTPTSGGLVSSTFQPRIVQFALKLIY